MSQIVILDHAGSTPVALPNLKEKDMSGKGARQRRTARRKKQRHPEIQSLPKRQLQKYEEVMGSPYGFILSCLAVAFIVVLAIIITP